MELNARDPLEMTLEELRAELAELDKLRLAVKARGRAVAEAVRVLDAREHAAYYGLTLEAYEGVKRAARELGDPDEDPKVYSARFAKLMSAARRQRAVQVVKAMTAQVGAAAKGLGQ